MTISAPNTALVPHGADSKKPEVTPPALSSTGASSSLSFSAKSAVKVDAAPDTVTLSSAAQAALRQSPSPSSPLQSGSAAGLQSQSGQSFSGLK